MNFISIIIFFFALSLAFAMIARKVWLLRSGRLVPGSYEEADWTELSIDAVRTRLLELLKFSVHYGVLLALKIWIISAHLIKMFDRFVRRKLTQVLHKNAQMKINPEEKPSEFLQDMSARKSEVIQAIQNERTEEVPESK